jgi:SSS family transporter
MGFDCEAVFLEENAQMLAASPPIHSLDWAVIGGYLIGVIALGVWLGKGQKTTRDYFLGGRDLPWWAVAFSIVATETSALTFIGVPAMAYGGNLMFIQVVIGYVIGRIALAVVMVPFYFKNEIYSPYALIGKAFGCGAHKTAAVLFLIAGTLAAGVRVYVTCIPLQLMLDWSVVPAILLFVGLSLVYTYVGGIKAVVWTDAVQFVLFLAGGLFTLFYLPTLIEGGWGGAMELARTEGKLEWLNTDFALGSPYNIWMGVFGAGVFVIFTHGIDQLVAQRVLACRSVADGRKALIFCAAVILPMMMLFLMVGVLLWAHYQQTPIPIEIPENSLGKKQTDYVFPIFMLAEAPVGVMGLLLVGIFAAAMSSVSSALSALSSVTVMDLGLAKKEASDEDKLKTSRGWTLFWGLVLVGVAFASREVKSVMDAAFSLVGLASGGLLGGVLLALTLKQGRGVPVMIGMGVSLACMIGVKYGLKEAIHWPWYTAIGCGITLLVTMLATAVCEAREESNT